MKTSVAALAILCATCGSAAEILVEAESLAEHGGWVLDPQFLDIMGSPYLLAHGLGTPVANAKGTIPFPRAGRYRLWVRTKDWASPHQPGRFQLLLDGQPVEPTFGTQGDEWTWQDGGTVQISQNMLTVELQDLTGFDGRCDAIFFTTDLAFTPPEEPDQRMAAWRRALLNLPETPPPLGQFDVVVVGGGVAGCSAAVTAARLGLRVALVQNRPVLGGNSSSEIGIRPAGMGGVVVDEVAGSRRAEVIRREDNIQLLLGWHAFRVQKEAARIESIDVVNVRTNEEGRLRAPIFVDGTGDGWIGYRAGADYRMGREGRSEFDESLAPEEADRMTHGSTLFFKVRFGDGPRSFPDVPWAQEVSQDHVDLRSDHSWEYGHNLDMIQDAERIRDHLFRAIYGTFGTVKQRFAKKTTNLEFERVNYIAARGESRRLMGDYILTENDIRSARSFPDRIAMGSLVFCLHYPGKQYDFRNEMKLISVKPYPIPFRCLYSRNVDNLMMAGRDISATHVAYASTKLMKTGGQLGVATGAAAFLCKKHNTTPRGIYTDHIKELQNVIDQRGEYREALKPEADDD